MDNIRKIHIPIHFLKYLQCEEPTVFGDSLSVYEALCALYDILVKQVTPTVNKNAEILEKLKNYVEHYFDNLDVQDEINHKLDEMAESGQLAEIIGIYLNSAAVNGFDTVTDMKEAENLADGSFARTLGYNAISDKGGATYKIRSKTDADDIDEGRLIAIGEELVAELIASPSMSAAQFGAVNESDEDQAPNIQKAVDFCIEKNVAELTLDGNYFVSNSILVDSADHLTIKNGVIRVHVTDTELNAGFNPIYITSSSNVDIEGISIIETNPTARSRKLRCGGILMDMCDHSTIRDCYFENTSSGAMLLDSYCCNILNNKVDVSYQSAQFAMSGVLNFGSDESLIQGNTIRGEFYDGCLSIFGDSEDVIVSDNIVDGTIAGKTSSLLSQGITIDSGVKNCICSNNYVEGMFYGIDNKSDVHNTIITGNTVKGCKIAITDRLGENTAATQTFNTTIEGNKIIITEVLTTDSNASYLTFGKYYYVGIYVGGRLSCRIKNNDVTTYGAIARTILGISASQADSSNLYILSADIANNNVDLASGFGATSSSAPSGSAGYALQRLAKGVFTGNTFKVDSTANTYAMIELRDANSGLLIQGNNAHCTNEAKHSFIVLDGAATLTNSQIIGNHFNRCRFDDGIDFTNVVEGSKYTFKGHRCTSRNLTANTWSSVGKITSPYDTIVQLKVRGMSEASGAKWIEGVYNIAISGTTITATAISEHKNNLDVQFVNNGTNRSFDIQVKANTNANGFSHLFVTDIMSAQALTIANA